MANDLLDYWLLVLNNWLLHNLRLLVDDLPFNWVVFNSFLIPINGHVLDHLIVSDLGNVLSLIFNGIIISHVSLPGNLDSLSYFFVFHYASFVGDILNSAFAFDWRLLSDNRLSDDWLGNHLLSNRLGDILWGGDELRLNNSLGQNWSLLDNGLLIISRSLLYVRLGGNR